MFILYLGKRSKLIPFLSSVGNVVQAEDKQQASAKDYDCIISYGYRYKIPARMVDQVNGHAINLHISYLPWNKGADPNYWSWKDDTPKGVTIHYISDEIDGGDIIVQKRVSFESVKPPLTLENTYEHLTNEIEDLFIHNWTGMFYLSRKKQCGDGSSHRKSDMPVLPDGWNTGCYDLQTQ